MMLKNSSTFASFTSENLDEIKNFYEQELGINVAMDGRPEMIMFESGTTRFMIYYKADHKPANFTVLNFEVKNLNSLIKNLTGKGINLEKVEGANKDGIAIRKSTKMAWIKDPSKNWIGLFENAEKLDSS